MLAQRTLLQASRATLSKTPTRLIHSTPKLLQAAAREEQAAHTASQRVRYWIKSLPVETYPLFVVCGFSLSFGVYSFVRPALQDPTLRLKRSIAHVAGGHH
ncbi:hypothetical protein D6C85_06673 [Aureobasidium pullulans]|uniref:Uncharacterized protein n=1 Tax=Aureobasidium pullulans TaxID=5580 RepID=A0A4S9WU04_AURPU|nr:hypothetical protein D6C85_06673 [Aureobasidium pullulans]TIA24130.1 hypothetical protein D6C81_02641 [Aureobasidium pullulans]